MPPVRGSIRKGVDQRNHPFAPGLPPGWREALKCTVPKGTVNSQDDSTLWYENSCATQLANPTNRWCLQPRWRSPSSELFISESSNSLIRRQAALVTCFPRPRLVNGQFHFAESVVCPKASNAEEKDRFAVMDMKPSLKIT